MSNTTSHKQPSEDSNHALRHAVQKLEAFSSQNSAKTSSQVEQEIVKAVEVIKRHYPHIQKFKKGNPEEQKLANSTLEAIKEYNSSLASAQLKPSSWRDRVSRFFYEKCGIPINKDLPKNTIELPQPASVQFVYSNAKNKKISQQFESAAIESSSKKITSFMQTTAINQEEVYSKQEADAFRVKAISLLKNHGIRFTSPTDEFLSIRSTPIQATIQTTPSENSALTKIIMRQVLTPLPGEEIEFKGEFHRNIKTLKHSFPVSESFVVTSKSHQTGFPHPSQHHGWALADQLIPLYPQQLELMPTFLPFLRKKQQIAQELLPNAALNAKAKELLKSKKLVFEEHKTELLTKHHKLNLAILKTSSENTFSNAFEVIRCYFNRIAEQKFSYVYLCEVQESMISNFIAHPYAHLYEQWIEKKHESLFVASFKERAQAALKILQEATEKNIQDLIVQKKTARTPIEQETLEYIICMGHLTKKAMHMMILQHLSEVIGFAPPMLDQFEQKMQVALYTQLLSFQDELVMAWGDDVVYARMLRQLQADVELFEMKAGAFERLESVPAEIVSELEVYFNARYYELL